MATTHRNKHLTLADREQIETGIRNNATKRKMAASLGKDGSTIGKEIAKRRALTYRCKMRLECSHYKGCRHGRDCQLTCLDYRAFHCARRDRSPGACNGCNNYASCRFNKYRYQAGPAHRAYHEQLVATRAGLDLAKDEVARLAETIVPGIKKGLSPYHIVQLYPTLGICEKTLYNYIALGVFRPWALTDLDLRQKVKRRLPKKQALLYKKRADRRYLKNRTYQDYLNALVEEPDLQIVQMDTVYHEVKGPFIQTFKFLAYDFLVAMYHETKTAEAMLSGIDRLESILGPQLFRELVQLLLTDRGTEFSAAEAMETSNDNTNRTRVFYCDPMASGQKGSLEKRHAELRYIVPKQVSLRTLGLHNQAKLNLALSHVNSVPRKQAQGKTPFELLRFYQPEMVRRLEAFGITEVPKDQVRLNPDLLH